MDIHVKAEQLLHTLANNLFDRDPSNPKPVCFTTGDMQHVEHWISELLEEFKKDIASY